MEVAQWWGRRTELILSAMHESLVPSVVFCGVQLPRTVYELFHVTYYTGGKNYQYDFGVPHYDYSFYILVIPQNPIPIIKALDYVPSALCSFKAARSEGGLSARR